MRLFKRLLGKPRILNCLPLSLHFKFFRDFFSGKSERENQSKRRAVEQGNISWVCWQRGNYFESATLIHFDNIYLVFLSVYFKSFDAIFMSACFKPFDVSHNFSRTAALLGNHVVCMSQTNLVLNKLSE